jgi:hypothetical protein
MERGQRGMRGKPEPGEHEDQATDASHPTSERDGSRRARRRTDLESQGRGRVRVCQAGDSGGSAPSQ